MKTLASLKSFLLGSTLLAASWSAHAATATWDGGHSDFSGWHMVENWVGNTLPAFGSDLDVHFNNNIRPTNRIEYSRTIRSLNFGSGATVDHEIRLMHTTDGGKPLTLGGSGQAASITNNGQGTKSIGTGLGTIVLANNLTLTNNSSGNLRLMSPVSGGFSITKNGTGPVVMGVANSYSGGTVINTGTVTMSVADALGTSGAITFAGATSTIVWGGTNTQDLSSRMVMNNGAKAILNTGGNSVIFASAIGSSSTAGLVKQGAGTLTLNAASTHSGGTTVEQGTLTVGVSGSLGATTGALTVGNTNSTAAGTNSILNLTTGANTTVGTLSGSIATPTSGTNTATINTQTSRTFSVNQTANATYAGKIGGAGNFTLGSGSTHALALAGVNTYTGATTISSGTLEVQGSISTSSSITNNAALIFNSASAQSYGNAIGGSGTLTKQGAGTLTLSGASNDFTGAVSVTGGTLKLSTLTDTRNGTGNLQISNGATLEYSGSTQGTTRGLTLTTANGGGVNVSGSSTELAMSAINGTSSDFTKSGAGTFNIAGNSEVTRLVVNEGTYRQTGGVTVVNTPSTGLQIANVSGAGYRLEAGTLRTNRINMLEGNTSSKFHWGAGTLTMVKERAGSASGGPDRSVGSASGPVVDEGTIINVTGKLTTSAGSNLDLGPMYTSGPLLYDRLVVSGALDLTSLSDRLTFGVNPYFLRPSSPNSVATGDWGTLRLILADSVILGGGQGFDSVIVGNDAIGWRAWDPGGLDPAAAFSGAGDLPLNTYHVEYVGSGYTGNGIQAGGAVLFHYKVAGSVPEPVSAGLLVGGTLILRALRRRRI